MVEPDSVISQIFPAFPSFYLVMSVMTLILVGCYAGSLAFLYQTRKGKAPQATGLL
jgi:hypothetical protein